MGQVEALLPPRVEGYSFAVVEPPGAGGRYAFYHSWGYSLLAAPLIRLVSLTGMSALWAFTLVNALLVLGTAAVLYGRAGPRVTLLVLGGAGLWWIDKAHPDLFVLCTLLVAMILLPRRPEVSLGLQGLAGLQYPVFGIGLVASVAWLGFRGRLGERGVQGGAFLGVALLLIPSIVAIGRAAPTVPLSETIVLHAPGRAELAAALIDPNLGLAFGWPALVLATLAGLAVAVMTRRLRADTVVLLALVAGALLVAVALPGRA